nr:hypothetical protein [Bacteroidota bacterium]
MQKITFYILVGIICFGPLANGQEQQIKEAKPIEFSAVYLDLWGKLDSITKLDPNLAIATMDKNIPLMSNPYERFNMYLWCYPAAFDKLKAYDKLLDMLIQAQREGFYFMLRRGESAWPDWIPELEKLNGFEAFIAENDTLKARDQENATAEYFIKLPEQYDPDKKYPLLLVLHGGIGSHYQSSQSWTSEHLDKEFIMAFLQGDMVQGKFQRSFNRESMDNILAIYEQVIEDYAVDTSSIFAGGPSAGGMRSIIMGYDDRFQLTGLLLAFPVVPRNIGDEQIDIISNKKLRVVLMTGETDFGLVQQKKFMVNMDEKEIPNRFLIFPEKGHQYPEDFSHHIDTSIDFLLNIEKEEEN